MIRRVLAAIATRIANWADPDRYICHWPNTTGDEGGAWDGLEDDEFLTAWKAAWNDVGGGE